MTRHPHPSCTRSALLAVLIFVSSTAWAWPAPDPPVRYTLTADATYQEGCFDPCMCPILIGTKVEGSFLLTEVEVDGPWQRYDLTQVSWIVPLFDGSQHLVSGEGTYRVDPVAGAQQMVLDLQIDDQPVEHFDSQVAELTTDWPALKVLVSIHQLYCYDVVFDVAATPAGSIPVAQLRSWGSMKHAFIR